MFYKSNEIITVSGSEDGLNVIWMC